MVVGFTQLLGHSVFTSYPERFLLLFPQGPGAGAVREEASLEGGTAECLCGSGKKHHTPCPGAAAGTEGDTFQPGSYPFHFLVPGHVIILILSFSDLSLPASQGGSGCWYLSYAWVPEPEELASAGFCLQIDACRWGQREDLHLVLGETWVRCGCGGKRQFRELGTERPRPCWERYFKYGDEADQHAVEGQEKTYMWGRKGW